MQHASDLSCRSLSPSRPLPPLPQESTFPVPLDRNRAWPRPQAIPLTWILSGNASNSCGFMSNRRLCELEAPLWSALLPADPPICVKKRLGIRYHTHTLSHYTTMQSLTSSPHIRRTHFVQCNHIGAHRCGLGNGNISQSINHSGHMAMNLHKKYKKTKQNPWYRGVR